MWCAVHGNVTRSNSLHPRLHEVLVEGVQVSPDVRRDVFAEIPQFTFQATNFGGHVGRLHQRHVDVLPEAKRDSLVSRVHPDSPEVEFVPRFGEHRLGEMEPVKI